MRTADSGGSAIDALPALTPDDGYGGEMTEQDAGSSRRRVHRALPASALLATALATLVVSCNDRSPTKPAAPSAQVAAPSLARTSNAAGSGELVSDARG